MNKIKQLRSLTEKRKKNFLYNVSTQWPVHVTWLEELRVELLSTGPRLSGVLPGAHRRVVRLLRLPPGCGRPEVKRASVYWAG